MILMEHGGYRNYLHRFGLDEYLHCPESAATLEDPEHIMLHCRRFEVEKRRSNDTVNAVTGLHNIVKEILKSELEWSLVLWLR